MKVWVVTHWVRYEGEDMLGVFASAELAWEFLRAQERRGDLWREVETGFLRASGDRTWDVEGWAVEEWPVTGTHEVTKETSDE